jgi:hypothetical protein
MCALQAFARQGFGYVLFSGRYVLSLIERSVVCCPYGASLLAVPCPLRLLSVVLVALGSVSSLSFSTARCVCFPRPC